MNYLAHAWRLLERVDVDLYEVAGVATPDWLSVAARRTKCRSRDAERFLAASDPRVAAVARGVIRHHADDAWFHESPAFGRLSLGFAKRLREQLSEPTSMRPWFVGHILVEMLLDDALAASRPGSMDAYYDLIDQVEAGVVAEAVHTIAGRDVGRLAEFIERFRQVRFLEDYRDDERLLMRLNQVLSRVGLPALPAEFLPMLPAFRIDVSASCADLIRIPDSVGEPQTGPRVPA